MYILTISVAVFMPSSGLLILQRYPKSVVVRWHHMYNRPDEDLYQYYSYHVMYSEKGSSDWIRERIVPYNPDDDPPQNTIDGLTSHTEYQVRILGVRSKGDLTDEETADSTRIETFVTLYGTLYLIICSYIYTIFFSVFSLPDCPTKREKINDK